MDKPICARCGGGVFVVVYGGLAGDDGHHPNFLECINCGQKYEETTFDGEKDNE